MSNRNKYTRNLFKNKMCIILYMSEFKCIICKYKTDNSSNFNRHNLTEKHVKNINNTFQCVSCKFATDKQVNYKRHLLTQKHLKLNPIQNNNLENNLIIQIEKHNEKIDEKIDKRTQELLNEINKLKEANEKLKEANDKNTNKIVKEARNIKSSILTMLNTHFKDTPSIEYIEQKPFFIELEKEYNAKINDGTDKLFIRIFSDYNKKKLVKTLSDLILKFVKKDQQKFQAVFNIDSARSNFATKIDDFWLNDKKGLQLRKFTVDKVVSFMIDVLEVFRLQLVEIRKENIKNPTSERNDYLMENQTLLLEVVSFLTNSNTHTKIITQLSPNLRCDEQLLLLK